MNRGPRNTDNYMVEHKRFNLDAGWQMLNTGHPDQIIQYFKNTDIDPRELILLFAQLSKTSSTLVQQHLKSLPTNYLYDYYKKTHAQTDVTFDLTKKHAEAKESVKQLLDYLNAKYLSELRRDDTKMAEFMYSNFSHPYQQYIKTNEQQPLKDIVSLVQTALIKL